jgi:hypothetical protein
VKPRRAAWGSWPSPLNADQVAAAGTRIYQPRRQGNAIYWLEVRPTDAGRTVLVRQRNGQREDLVPAPWSVRSRVHEYGGGAWCAHDEDCWFVNDADQSVWHRDARGHIAQLTPADARRYADLQRDAWRGRLLAVCEDHAADGEPANRLVAVHDDGRIETLLEGRDFYASPRLSPDGYSLCWQAWDHPRLPWNGNELWVATLDGDGRPTRAPHDPPLSARRCPRT